MTLFDEQEFLIIRQLVRDPRQSDTAIAETTGVSTRTVNRKRQRLEEDGIISYHTQVDLSSGGSGQFPARHLYTVHFRVGVTLRQLLEDIRREPNVRTLFTEMIFESHIAEIDGKLALVLMIEGEGDREIVEAFHEKIVPSLHKNHGADSIEKISTMRLLAPVRVMRNYLPQVNMEAGFIKKEWPEAAIYVGHTASATESAAE